MTSATSELLADRYRLSERIATGGMGVVWRASDERLGRDVAIKLIRPEYADDPTFRQRLDLEARATAAIRSPHVVRLHDVCEQPDPDGGYQSFIVMELVAGQPLSAVLRDGRLSIAETVSAMQQAAAALAAAHEQQIVHRDIKPANLMLDSDGQVTVLDFGIARAADAVALTATDLVLGTPRYIAPEQADGRGASAASDVYSLGVVAFECLAGEVPFDAGSDVATALAHLREPVPPLPPDVPPALARLVERMLAKAPGDRPAADDVAAALAAMATTTSPTEPIAVAVPAAAGITRAMRTLQLPRRERLTGYDMRDTRSAPLRVGALVPPTLVVVVILLLTAAIAGLVQNSPQPAAAATGGTGTHTVADHVGPTTVTVNETRYDGVEWPIVRAELRLIGLHPVARFVGTGPADTVLSLAPTGKVARGSTITVLVSRAGPAAGPQPKPKPKPKPPHPGPAGGPPGQVKKHDGGDPQGDG